MAPPERRGTPLSGLLLLGTLAPFRNAYLLRGLVVWIAVRLVLAFGGVAALGVLVAGVLVVVVGGVVWLDARRRGEDLFLGNLGIPGWTIGVMSAPLALLAEVLLP